MPLIEDRLTPRDGLNNYAISFARMEPQPQTRGGLAFVFSISDSMQPICELSVSVVTRGQGLDHTMVEAHNAIIDILRQLVFRADKSRAAYERFTRPAAMSSAEEDELSEIELL